MPRAVIVAICSLAFGAAFAAMPMIENIYARVALSALAYALLSYSVIWIGRRSK